MKIKYKLITLLIVLSVLFLGQTINAEESKPTLIDPLNGKIFEVDWVSKLTTDENGNKKTVFYYDTFEKTVYDSNGEIVSGNYIYGGDYNYFTFGSNYITYTFHPNLSTYESFSGSFIVNYTKLPTIRVYKNKIDVLVQTSKFRIFVNGKEYKKTSIINLKPSTKYKVKIYKKATDYMEEELILSKTVKTKAK